MDPTEVQDMFHKLELSFNNDKNPWQPIDHSKGEPINSEGRLPTNEVNRNIFRATNAEEVDYPRTTHAGIDVRIMQLVRLLEIELYCSHQLSTQDHLSDLYIVYLQNKSEEPLHKDFKDRGLHHLIALYTGENDLPVKVVLGRINTQPTPITVPLSAFYSSEATFCIV